MLPTRIRYSRHNGGTDLASVLNSKLCDVVLLTFGHSRITLASNSWALRQAEAGVRNLWAHHEEFAFVFVQLLVPDQLFVPEHALLSFRAASGHATQIGMCFTKWRALIDGELRWKLAFEPTLGLAAFLLITKLVLSALKEAVFAPSLATVIRAGFKGHISISAEGRLRGVSVEGRLRGGGGGGGGGCSGGGGGGGM